MDDDEILGDIPEIPKHLIELEAQLNRVKSREFEIKV